MRKNQFINLIVEWRFNRVEIVSTDGNKITTTANIEMQLILKIEETNNENKYFVLPIVYIMIHMDVTQNSTNNIRTNKLQLIHAKLSNICFFLDIHFDTFLFRLNSTVYLEIKPSTTLLQEPPLFP